VVTLLTDFGRRDAYAGILKGVIAGICPSARLIDLTHEIPRHDVVAGALVLASAVPYFPRGTIHLAVVDPGVGSARAAVAVQTVRGYLVGPDNGLLYPAAMQMGIEAVVELRNARYFLSPVSATFHGRDLFAPVAAHLAAGVPLRQFGPERACLERLALPAVRREGGGLRGEVVYVDGFGNLITNIRAADLNAFSRGPVSVSVGRHAGIPQVSAYAEVDVGCPLAVLGSWGQLEVAVREGNAAEVLRARVGTPVCVTRRRP